MAVPWKRLFRIATIALLSIVTLLAILLIVTVGWRPIIGAKTRPLTDRKFEPTPIRLARGRYLVMGPAHCFQCHSESDHNSPGEPPLVGKEGAGSMTVFGRYRVVMPNLTPDPKTGIGSWTDDQLGRAIREGISHDGRVLFAMMPYQYFRRMSDEDLASVVVYLRSLPPVHNPLPPSRLPLPFELLSKMFPEPITTTVLPPNLSDPIERGAYYVAIAKCGDCHSPMDWRQRVREGLEFAGGTWFSDGNVAAPNITFDPSGISYYDEARFIQAMRTGQVGARSLSPVMPWWYFGHMTDEDLKAIFSYLRTLRPVKHRVDNTEPPTFCKLCRQVHGAGNQNGGD
jgi:mono/diheme cytochrome c family protein